MTVLRRRTRFLKHRVTTAWPSAVPGIYFAGTGKWALEWTPTPYHVEDAEIHAAGWLALDQIACGITSLCAPAQVLVAQERLAKETARWTPVSYIPGLRWKAQVTLSLRPEDSARAQEYDDRLRETHLQSVIEQARLTALRDSLVNDSTLARAWWLDQHGSELQKMPWKEFSAQILPALRSEDDPHSIAVRVASILEEVLVQLHGENETHRRFILTARAILHDMGWQTIAEKLPAD